MKSTLTGAAVLMITVLALLAQARPQQGAQRTAPPESDARPIRVRLLGPDRPRPHPSPTMFPLLAAPLARGGPGSLQAIGTAADELARHPNGPAQQYVPQMSQVLFSTSLVGPSEDCRAVRVICSGIDSGSRSRRSTRWRRF